MVIRRSTRVAFWVAASVLLLVCLVRFLPVWLGRVDASANPLQRLELLTYDWRARAAFAAGGPAATNLAAIFIDDEGLRLINETLEYHWPLPRHLFGRILRELKAQGAARVACDIFFLDRHKDYAETRMTLPDGQVVSSDEFLGYQLRQTGNVVLGTPGELVEGRWQALPPVPTLRTNALALGYASADRDADGVLRRVRPYRDDPRLGRIWHLGILLVAGQLGLDLDHAVARPGELRLSSTNGSPAISIPLDREGLFYADWSLAWNDPRMFKAAFTDLLEFDHYRQVEGELIEPALTDHLVVIGSLGSGSNISDVGATPLNRETYLVSLHWNVANSLLTGRLIRPPSTAEEMLCILAMGSLSAVLTWRLRPVVALVILILTMAGYIWVGAAVFVQWRYWLPLVTPLGGAMLMTHLCMVTYRTVFEQRERRHLRSRFVKLVSPEVVDELLAQERVAVGGAMRPLTVMFADVRGFTRMTEQEQIEAQALLATEKLEGRAAEAFLEERAQATLANVSELLAIIADEVKRHAGTLDKYIGDCVMAFWGAPVRNEDQAVLAVRAAVESQRAIAALNTRRQALNESRAQENQTRAAQGERLLPMVPLLALGIGINTGTAVVGFMGSNAHFVNYTVFGREVNLASRLEGLAGAGEIIISAATFGQIEAKDPDLAARCAARPPRAVKGIAEPVAIYEVRWAEEAPARA